MASHPRSKNSSPKRPKSAELLHYGLHICEALAKRRRNDVIRVYCIESRVPVFKDLLQWCAAARKAYHIVSSAELETITGSVHHEGVAILARMQPYAPLATLAAKLKERGDVPLMYLDGVQNPHNIGTIMRAMASFAWPYLIGAEGLAPLNAAATRMSEGGAEYVEVFTAASGPAFCSWAKALGYTVLGSSSHEASSLYAQPLPKRVAFILGHEMHGMAPETAQAVDRRIVIPCSGQVESLNVAVASGLLMGEYTRLHQLPQIPKAQ